MCAYDGTIVYFSDEYISSDPESYEDSNGASAFTIGCKIKNFFEGSGEVKY